MNRNNVCSWPKAEVNGAANEPKETLDQIALFPKYLG